MGAPPGGEAPRVGRLLPALIVGQIGLHAAMAGLRMAAPLDALTEGASAWRVGLLLALFAVAPMLLALAAGRMADRHGYHRPLQLAVMLACAGLLSAALSTLAGGPLRFGLLALGAVAAGAGANIGMIAVQRTGGQFARSAADRVRVFSWLGIAPSFANVVGPVGAGLLIDLGGFGLGYAMLLVLPLASLVAARQVPRQPVPLRPTVRRPAHDLLRTPGLRRLLLVNWLLSAGWDVHTFVVPILGHQREFSATTIGLVLGTFTLAVTAIRLLVPLLAERIREGTVMRAAMLGSAALFAVYPLSTTAWQMAVCAAMLGVTLGCVQPIVMVTLHRLTPDERHGEALALRSMAINASSTVMPLLFGAFGAATGAALLFWIVGASIGAGATLVRGLETVPSGRSPDPGGR